MTELVEGIRDGREDMHVGISLTGGEDMRRLRVEASERMNRREIHVTSAHVH